MEEFIKNNIDEFERNGKKFIYFNIARLANNEQLETFANAAMTLIQKYPPKSIYVITSHVAFFDTRTKDICSNWIIFNKPYVIASALVDINGLMKMAAKSIYKRADREMAPLFPALKEAVEWLLTQNDYAEL